MATADGNRMSPPSLGHSVAVIGVLVLLAFCGSTAAQENDGLYRGKDFEAFKKSHPVRTYYGHNPDWMRDRQKEADAWVAGLDAKTLKAIIPHQLTSPDCTCPGCREGNQWKLDLARPGKLVCGKCNAAYPNAKYPENRKETSYSWFNKPVTVP